MENNNKEFKSSGNKSDKYNNASNEFKSFDSSNKTKTRDIVKEIKDGLDIVDVIGKHVTLTRRDNDWYVGAVSSSSKSGKSLNVNVKLQYFNDFACALSGNPKGDVFDAIAYFEKLDTDKDFPEILKIAAKEAGVELSELTEEEERVNGIRLAVQDTLTEAAEYYHNNLTPERREYINKKWGINNDTIDALKIGYALPGNKLIASKQFDQEALISSGLILCSLDHGKISSMKDHFNGRVVFPYWSNGKVVAFAARGDKDNLGTEDNDYENSAKYKKLLTHSEKNPYVAECVNNRYIWGEDTLRGKDFCIVTEGIADAIVLMQNGYPVLSPVTVQFSDNDIERLVSIAKRLKTVYICNDNEISGAGEKGALKTGKLLKLAGVDVRIIILPRPEGEDKIDVAEYFLNNSSVNFDILRNNSVTYFKHLVKKLPKSEDKSTNLETVSNFIKAYLTAFPADVVDSLINNEIKNHFAPNFSRDECRNAKGYFKRTSKEDREAVADFGKYHPPFSEVAERVMEQQPVITFDDTKEFYIYRNGVYIEKGAETIIKALAIAEYGKMKEEHEQEAEVPGIEYVREVLEYIRIYTHVFRDELDNNQQHTYTINVKNGLYNLKTGKLEPHTPKYISIRQIPITYSENAQCPNFTKFMSEVVEAKDAQFLLEFIGYCLIPDTRQEKAVMLCGNGANGKSKLIDFVIALIGQNNVCTTSLQRLCNDKFAMSELYGKTLNVFPDMSNSAIKDDETFKGVVTGDVLSAQRKYGHSFQFRNIARQMFSVNDVPPTADLSYAFCRRWKLIKFPYTFVDNPEKQNEKKRDRNLADKLISPDELAGAFNLVVACLNEMLRNGKFSYMDSAEQTGEIYAMKSDPARVFVETCTETSAGNVYKKELHDNFKKWCELKGIKDLTIYKFSARLKKMGLEEGRPWGENEPRDRVWTNMKMNDTFAKEMARYIPGQMTISEIKDSVGVPFWQKFTGVESEKHPDVTKIEINQQEKPFKVKVVTDEKEALAYLGLA